MSDHQYLTISLSQIQVFLMVAEYKNFTLAAQRLSLTQSAVSKTIATLEGILQMSLFERKKNLELTPAGALLHKQWSGTIEQVEHSILEATMLNTKQKEVIRVGVPNYLNLGTLLPTVDTFLKDYPNISLVAEEVDFNDLFLQLPLGGYDCIVTVSVSEDLLDSIHASYTAVSEPVTGMITMHESNPLAKRKSITLADMKDEEFFALSAMSYRPYTDLLEKHCQRFGFSPNITAYFPNVRSLIATVIVSGTGVFLSNSFISEINHPKLKNFPIADSDSSLVVAWMEENRKKKPALDKLIKAISLTRDV